MTIAPDFQTWCAYPKGAPFAIGARIRTSLHAEYHRDCYGYVRGYSYDGRVLVEIPHVGQQGWTAYKLKDISKF